MARRSVINRATRMTALQPRLRRAVGIPVPRRASISAPSVARSVRKFDRTIKIRKVGVPRIKGAHPLHDPAGRIHAMTGAHLTDGHLRPHYTSVIKPYKIPKGMIRKRIN